MANNNPNYAVIIKQAADPADESAIGLTIEANLPDTFAFDVSSDYQAPYAQGIFGNGAIAQIAAVNGKRLTTQAQTARIWQGSTENELMLDLEFYAENDPEVEVVQQALNLLKLTAPTIDPTTGMLKSPGPRLILDDTGQIASEGGASLANSGKQALAAGASMLGFKNVQTNKGLNGPNSTVSATNAASTSQPAGAGTADFWKRQVRNQVSIQIGRYAFFDSVVVLNVQKTYSNHIDAQTGLPMSVKISIRFAPLFLLTQDDIVNIFKRKA